MAASTYRLVGDSLFGQMQHRELSAVLNLSTQLSPKRETLSCEAFYELLKTQARENNCRLLVLDSDGKVQTDTYDEICGTVPALAEVRSILDENRDTDFGYHRMRIEGTEQAASVFDRLLRRDVSLSWMGCFTASMVTDNQKNGVLLLMTSVQDTVDALIILRDRMIFVLLAVLILVLVIGAVFSRVTTKPIAELSAGFERVGRGEYGQQVRVGGNGEMAQLAAAFNLMSEKIRSFDEARNQFVSNASHELKTPLTTMKIMVQSMQLEPDMPSEIRQDFLSDIDQEINRLSGVVSDLLTLVHIDSHKMKLHREKMGFADTVRSTVRRLTPLAESRKQQILCNLEDECEMVADASKLEQVCYNIIENAIKYTQDGGTVTVHLSRVGRDAVLEITDTGVGIPKEALEHVFERFYRVDKARSRDTGGTGLGLSIVQQIVRLHAGTVTVQSELGVGTTFTIQLPVGNG